MFVERCVTACESLSNLSHRYVFVEHSLHSKNFCHRTQKNSKYCYLFSCGTRVPLEDNFCTENEFCRMKVLSYLMRNLVNHRNHSLVFTKSAGYKFLELFSRYVVARHKLKLWTGAPPPPMVKVLAHFSLGNF